MPYVIREGDGLFSLFQVDHENNVRMVGSGPDRDSLLTKTEKGAGKCDCDGDCEDCNKVLRSVSYAKYINSVKCGCGNSGKLITIDDLRDKRKKKKSDKRGD